jgi:hypothetical protein
MVKAIFDYEGDSGLLTVITHFGHTVTIPCEKYSDESFRLGGTAVHDIVVYEGVILDEAIESSVHFRAFRNEQYFFEGEGVLSPEPWTKANLHCYVIEYYPLDMEGKKPGWFVSKTPLKNANHLFINLDVLDGGGNVVKRYRVSPFTGDHRIMQGING